MLYLVGTPIGNLKEFNNYAVEILNKVDYILCEDTRTSSVLLNHYQIKKPLKSYHKFNEREMLNKVVSDLKDGKDVALISDAGMPAVSDPGNILVNEVKAHELEYTVVSGPCALINAFILSGFNAPFTFIGFLPEKNKDVNNLLMPYKNIAGTLIFYVSCHNIEKDFETLLNVFGDREVCVVREITKLHEEKTFTTLKQGYSGDKRGEFVLVLNNVQSENELNNLSVKEHLLHYMKKGFTKQDAIKFVCSDRDLKKSEVYKVAIDL